MTARRLFKLICTALLIPAALAACGKLSHMSYNSLSEDPPSDLTAKATSSSSVHLKWKAPISGVSAGYDIYRSDGGSGAYVEIDSFDIGNAIDNSIDNSIVNSPFYDDTGLTAGQLYCYEVSSYNASGVQSKKSNSACVSIPGVLSVDPANLSNGIAWDPAPTISVTFTDPIKASTISESNFTMLVNSGADIGNSVVGSVIINSVNNVRFTPGASLENGTTYQVTLGSGVQFDDGSDLDGPYTWKFTTAP